MSKAGIIATAKAGDMRFTDTREDEKERGITIKSTAISMYFEVDKEEVSAIQQKTEGDYSSTISIRIRLIVSSRQRIFDQFDLVLKRART